MPKRLLPPILLMLAVSAGAAAAQTARSPAGPPSYAEALERLAVADTAAAVELLRQATREAPDFGPAFLRLGALLMRDARPGSTGIEQRREAWRLLDRAFRLMGNDPELLLEYGVLLGQERLLERALAAAERDGVEFPPELAAQMHYVLGLSHERQPKDWSGLVLTTPAQLAALTCDELSRPLASLDEAVAACREQTAERAGQTPSLEDLTSEEGERMLGHYWQALVLNPAHIDAGVRLLLQLARMRDWEQYERVVRRLRLVLPDEPRVHLLAGIGLHERGRSADADTAFQRALALLPPEDRKVFDDVEPLLTRRVKRKYAAMDSASRAETARLFFATKDPILLTAVEERRIEHYARVAQAYLRHGPPSAGGRGWQWESNELWIRYGMPIASRQMNATLERLAAWIYGEEDRPEFTFRMDPGGYVIPALSPGPTLLDDLRGLLPELYHPRTVTKLVGLPVQVVRLRGSERELTRLELIAGMPLDSLGPAGLPVESGAFLFDDAHQPLWEKRIALESGAGAPVVSYRVEVPPGAYRAALEARLAGPDSIARPLARFRQDITTVGFTPGDLGVSDLLLAYDVEPLTSEPRTREDLRIAPNPSMTYAPGQPIALYFELYNLLPDAEQHASYELELVVTVDEIQREGHALTQLLAELADKWGLTAEGTDAIQLRFRKEANVLARDMIPEYFKIQIPDSPDGRYTLRLTARDRNAGRSTTTQRTFWIRESP